MKLSFAILYNNEVNEINELLKVIAKNVNYDYEIIIVKDADSDHNEESERIFKIWELSSHIKLYSHSLNNNFADAKNYLNNMCNGDFIFNIDADEIPHIFLLQNLLSIIESNLQIDAYWVPRINIVDGITPEHIQKWVWKQNEHGWINFPDFQMRIYKNSPDIKWVNTWKKNDAGCHEVLQGFKQFSKLPIDELFCIYHIKTIDRQEVQNERYLKILK